MKKIEEFQTYLSSHDFTLSTDGIPLFDRSAFVEKWPQQIVPFYHRKNRIIDNPKETLLCNFCKDKFIFRRIDKVLSDTDEYKKYMGVIGCDITVTRNMETEFQNAVILLNMLFNAILVSAGIKIVMNTRIGCERNLKLFESIPKNIMWASGFLGCKKLSEDTDTHYLAKTLTFLPSKLIIYGKRDNVALDQLNRMGINYRLYKDFHRTTTS